jgi:hypothetical protein
MPLLTQAERSGYSETSKHADVMAFIDGLRDLRSPLLQIGSFGTSPQGRDLPLLVLSSAGIRSPEQARELGRPVVLLQNGIHAGEVEGKEAALMVVRELLRGAEPGLLDRITLLVVPLFNPDGNDAMDSKNRALHLPKLSGQIGPARVGTRVNSLGINLNRDYIRHEAPEMRAMQTQICQPWQPDLSIDSHATNGSVHRFWMTVDIPHTVESGPAGPIEYMRRSMVPALFEAVRKGHGIESGWYGNFVEDERALDAGGEVDPHSKAGEGWMTYPHHPRFGSNYRGLGGRLDLLLECYSYLSFEERTRTTRVWMWESLRYAAARPAEIKHIVAAGRRPPPRVAVQYELGLRPEPVSVLSSHPRLPGGSPVDLRIPHLAAFRGTVVVDRPEAYALPARLAPFLRGHGLPVEAAPARASAQVCTLERQEQEAGRGILEAAGHGRRVVSWVEREVELGEGWLRLPTEHPLGALACYLCEPESDDGLIENGMLPTPAPGQPFEIYRL